MYVCICLSVYTVYINILYIYIYIYKYFIYIYISLYIGNYVLSALLYSTRFLFSQAQGGFWSSNHHITVPVTGERERKKGQKVFLKVPPTSHPSHQRAWERWSLGQLITTGIKLNFVAKKKERKDYRTFFLFLLFIHERT